MMLSLGIAKRYFFSRKSGGSFNLISIISGISLLGYFDAQGKLLLEPGWFDFYVGGSAAATLSVPFLYQ